MSLRFFRKKSADLESGRLSRFFSGREVSQSQDKSQTKDPNLPSAVQNVIQSEGESLDSGTRSRMESHFSHDFSHVRVHTDAEAAGSSQAVDARAYAVGNHIVFNTSEYKPGTLIGDALLAHELAHVVQQSEAEDKQPGKSAQLDSGLEREADTGALAALKSLTGSVKNSVVHGTENFKVGMRTGLSLQRCEKKKLTDEEKYEIVKEKMSKAEKSFRVASEVLTDKEMATKAGEVADTLGKANKAIDTLEKAVVIYEGMKGFKEWHEVDIYEDQEAWAKAAGKSVAALGEVMKMSKFPVISSFGEWLSHAGDFFNNMRIKIRPGARYRDRWWNRIEGMEDLGED